MNQKNIIESWFVKVKISKFGHSYFTQLLRKCKMSQMYFKKMIRDLSIEK